MQTAEQKHEWYMKTREIRLIKSREYYKNNKDKELARGKKYKKNNPKIVSKHNKTYRSKFGKLVDSKRLLVLKANPYMLSLASARRSSRRRNKEFSLTLEWAKSNWTGYCCLSGVKFVIGSAYSPLSPSIDRIDNTIGYTPDNCRFICMGINSLKYTGTDAEMYSLAEALILNRPKVAII